MPIFASQRVKIGDTSAKQSSELAAFVFGLHYLCFLTGGETGHPAAASGRVESDAAENNY